MGDQSLRHDADVAIILFVSNFIQIYLYDNNKDRDNAWSNCVTLCK